MAIKDPLMFITIEEFKNWKGFNNQLFDEITTPDSEIRYAIEIVSNNIDYLSGFTISKKWPEINPTKFTDNIQTATTHYVNFLLSKGVEYARGQASIGQGGIVYSQNNPEDPYFIPPQVFNYLRDINKYENMQGFPLNLNNKQSYFSKFLSNHGEINRLIEYLKILNLKSSDNRVKINIYQPENLDSPVVDIDTSGIKTDIDNSLWKINKDNPNFIKPKDDKGISANDKRIINVGTPTFLSDATTKEYVDDLVGKKQDKLIAGENIKIEENNVISATSGKVDLSDYYKKSVFMKGYFTYKDDRDQLWINDVSNSSLAISLLLNNRYNRLQTTNKTIAGAINELNKKQSTENIYTKNEVDHLLDDLSRNITDSHTLIINKCVKEAKEQLEQEIKDSKKEIENELPKLIDKALEKGFTDLINKLIDNKIKGFTDRLFDNKKEKINVLHFVNNIANAGLKTFTYKNSPSITEDNDIPNKKYVDEKLKEKWTKIADSKNNEITTTFYLKTTYRVWYCLNNYPGRNILVSATFRVESLTPYGWLIRFYDGKDGIMLLIENSTIKFKGDYKGTLCYLEKLQD